MRGALSDFAARKAETQNAAKAELLAKGKDFMGRPFTPERMAALREASDPEKYSGAALYSMLGKDAGAVRRGEKDANTRQRLLDLGIVGNRYLDQGSRSSAGINTRNYVVFDDKLLDITNRYAEGGPVAPGNIDLHNRPVVHNPDGSISTVRSITVGFGDKTYVLPTVVGGKVVSNREAIDHFRQTGEHLGAFGKREEADAYAQRLHEDQAKEYEGKARGGLMAKYGL